VCKLAAVTVDDEFWTSERQFHKPYECRRLLNARNRLQLESDRDAQAALAANPKEHSSLALCFFFLSWRRFLRVRAATGGLASPRRVFCPSAKAASSTPRGMATIAIYHNPVTDIIWRYCLSRIWRGETRIALPQPRLTALLVLLWFS